LKNKIKEDLNYKYINNKSTSKSLSKTQVSTSDKNITLLNNSKNNLNSTISSNASTNILNQKYYLKDNFSSSYSKQKEKFLTPLKQSACNSVTSINSTRSKNTTLNTYVSKLLERFDIEKKKSDLGKEILKEKYNQHLKKKFTNKPEINKSCKYYEKNSESFLKRVEIYKFISQAKKLELFDKETKRMEKILNSNSKLTRKMTYDQIKRIIEDKLINNVMKENIKQEKVNNILKKRELEALKLCTFKPNILKSSIILAENKKKKIVEKENTNNKNYNNLIPINKDISSRKDERIKRNLNELSFRNEKMKSEKKNSIRKYKKFSNTTDNKFPSNERRNKSMIIEKNSNTGKFNDRNCFENDLNKTTMVSEQKKNKSNSKTCNLYDIFNNSDITDHESSILKQLLKKKFNI